MRQDELAGNETFGRLVDGERRVQGTPGWGENRRRGDCEFGIPHCIGIIDGFHVNLATAPARDDAGEFHSRKERYGYNILGVVDDTKRFRYLHYGYPASSSDMRVQRAAEPLNHPDEHFSRDEYLLADSGFTASDQMVPMFRKTAGNTIMRGRPAYFNTVAATMRYQVEHDWYTQVSLDDPTQPSPTLQHQPRPSACSWHHRRMRYTPQSCSQHRR